MIFWEMPAKRQKAPVFKYMLNPIKGIMEMKSITSFLKSVFLDEAVIYGMDEMGEIVDGISYNYALNIQDNLNELEKVVLEFDSFSISNFKGVL